MARTIADLLVEALAAAGVERIWGVMGDSLTRDAASVDAHGSLKFNFVGQSSPGCYPNRALRAESDAQQIGMQNRS